MKTKKKVGRKPLNTGLTLRKDVVLKSLLRRIRNFYWDDFNEITKFKNYKYRRDANHFEVCLKEYISLRLRVNYDGDYLITTGNFISSKDTSKLISNRTSSLYTEDEETRNQMLLENKEVHHTLYKFSFSKFQTLVKKNSIRDLIIRYSNEVDPLSLSEDETIGLGMLVTECYQ